MCRARSGDFSLAGRYNAMGVFPRMYSEGGFKMYFMETGELNVTYFPDEHGKKQTQHYYNDTIYKAGDLNMKLNVDDLSVDLYGVDKSSEKKKAVNYHFYSKEQLDEALRSLNRLGVGDFPITERNKQGVEDEEDDDGNLSYSDEEEEDEEDYWENNIGGEIEMGHRKEETKEDDEFVSFIEDFDDSEPVGGSMKLDEEEGYVEMDDKIVSQIKNHKLGERGSIGIKLIPNEPEITVVEENEAAVTTPSETSSSSSSDFFEAVVNNISIKMDNRPGAPEDSGKISDDIINKARTKKQDNDDDEQKSTISSDIFEEYLDE